MVFDHKELNDILILTIGYVWTLNFPISKMATTWKWVPLWRLSWLLTLLANVSSKKVHTPQIIYDPVGSQPICPCWSILCWKSNMAPSILGPIRLHRGRKGQKKRRFYHETSQVCYWHEYKRLLYWKFPLISFWVFKKCQTLVKIVIICIIDKPFEPDELENQTYS